MRRFVFVLGGTLALFLTVAAAAAGSHSDGEGPKQDLVAGTGTVFCCNQPQLHVNAQRDPDTGAARGHFYIRYPTSAPGGGFDFRGRITCLGVVANSATLIGRIDATRGVSPNPLAGFVEGNFLRIRITDNGEPGTLDLVNFDPGQAIPPSCAVAPGDLAITQGNFIVHESPPLAVLNSLNLILAQFEAAADCPYGVQP
jgi:hypothetical protein